MHKKILQTGFSLGVLACLYLECIQMQRTDRIREDLMDVQADEYIEQGEIDFDNVSYNIVTEKIAVNPNYVYIDEKVTLYANKETSLFSSPEKDKQEIVFTLNKRDEVISLGYNSYNKTYKIEHSDGNIYYANAEEFLTDKNLILDEVKGLRYLDSFTNILEYPSETSNVLKEIAINEQIDLIAQNDNGYYQIKFDDIVGYIHQDYLSETKVNYVTDEQKEIAKIAKNNAGNYPCRSGYCAAWVEGVFRASSIDYPKRGFGNAIDYWIQWKHTGSTSIDNIPVGAVVVGSGSGSSLGNQYGHVGIYLGDGLVADNVGRHRIISIEEWADSQVGYCRGYHGYIGWVWPKEICLGEGK